MEEQVTSDGHCYAVGMANCDDGLFHSAAPVAVGKGWSAIFKEDHKEEEMQEDGSRTTLSINEGWQLKLLVEDRKTPKGGIWFGGNRFRILRIDPNFEVRELGERSVFWAHGSCSKGKGVHIISTGCQIIVGVYSVSACFPRSQHVLKQLLCCAAATSEYLQSWGY